MNNNSSPTFEKSHLLRGVRASNYNTTETSLSRFILNPHNSTERRQVIKQQRTSDGPASGDSCPSGHTSMLLVVIVNPSPSSSPARTQLRRYSYVLCGVGVLLSLCVAYPQGSVYELPKRTYFVCTFYRSTVKTFCTLPSKFYVLLHQVSTTRTACVMMRWHCDLLLPLYKHERSGGEGRRETLGRRSCLCEGGGESERGNRVAQRAAAKSRKSLSPSLLCTLVHFTCR